MCSHASSITDLRQASLQWGGTCAGGVLGKAGAEVRAKAERAASTSGHQAGCLQLLHGLPHLDHGLDVGRVQRAPQGLRV